MAEEAAAAATVAGAGSSTGPPRRRLLGPREATGVGVGSSGGMLGKRRIRRDGRMREATANAFLMIPVKQLADAADQNHEMFDSITGHSNTFLPSKSRKFLVLYPLASAHAWPAVNTSMSASKLCFQYSFG
jgi:hypothetical protein